MIKHYWPLIIVAGIISSALAETPRSVSCQANSNIFYIILGRVKEIKHISGEISPPKVIEENEKGGVIRLYPSCSMKLIAFSRYRAFLVTNGIASEIAAMKYPVALLMDQSLSITNDPKKISLFYAQKYDPPAPFAVSNQLVDKLVLKVSWEDGLCVQEGSVKFNAVLKQYKIILPTNMAPSKSQPGQIKRLPAPRI
ncbi:MAG: hypothetical protein NT011_02685 [Kiritimatiellaeota bacterium]|nr:hypothetical protein [Kiritimatiellota bacterium]